jgi:hypothetical protein
MRMSPGRWALACLLGCALIAVTLPPGARDEDSLQDYWWRPPIRLREDRMAERVGMAYQHARLVTRNYKAALDVETAGRLFLMRHDSAAEPVVSFAPDVPEFLRKQVSELVANERAARGEWRGHGAVGVMVVTDTATRLDGVLLPSLYDRDRPVTSVVLPATAANGDHCVTVVRLRHQSLTGHTSLLPADRLPLDGCAFTDAFGAPGPKIAEWLRESRYSHARRLSFEQPKADENRRFYSPYDEGGIVSMQCRGGDDAACVEAAVGADRDRAPFWDSYRNDLSVRAPDESPELLGEVGGFDETFMEAMVRDLGPARFQRVWRSQKPLPEAYFDETGEPFAGWVRGRLIQFYGPYHTGPVPAPESALLTIVAILALAAMSIRWAQRPYAI